MKGAIKKQVREMGVKVAKTKIRCAATPHKAESEPSMSVGKEQCNTGG